MITYRNELKSLDCRAMITKRKKFKASDFNP